MAGGSGAAWSRLVGRLQRDILIIDDPIKDFVQVPGGSMMAGMAGASVKVNQSPFRRCPGCSRGDGGVHTHFEGTVEHPLGELDAVRIAGEAAERLQGGEDGE